MRNGPPLVSRSDEQRCINYRLKAGSSAIHGSGVYTCEPIPGRRKIGEVTGEIISGRKAAARSAGADKIYLVYLSDTRALDCSHGNLLGSLNHSCGSNAFLRVIRDRVEVYAKRRIETGEEVTVDYGETPHAGGMACRCGTPVCRARI